MIGVRIRHISEGPKRMGPRQGRALVLTALFALAVLLAACAGVAPSTSAPIIESTPTVEPTVDAPATESTPTESTSTDVPTIDAPTTETLAAEMPNNYEVTIWTVEGGSRDFEKLKTNADLVSEFNPFWYELAPDGSIAGVVRDKNYIAELRAMGLRLVPTIANAFDRERVHRVIESPEARTAHAQALVDLVLENDFDGIDVDYESLYAVDKEDFTLFIEELAAMLHAEGKLLSIAVHPKENESGTWEGPQAQDYARLGAAVDMFKVMTYDYSWSTSPAGPIAPLDWVQRVISYTTSVVEPQKVYMGLPFYGYDWQGSQADSKVWDQIQQLIVRHDPEVERDATNEGHFVYGTYRPRTVYFNDSLTLETKLDAIFAEYPDLAGVAIWRLGGEDPANWDVLREWADR